MAAGRGSRARGSNGPPKQYAALAGSTVLGTTLRNVLAEPRVDFVQIVIHPDDEPVYRQTVLIRDPRVREPVSGGASRQASVRAGLEALVDARPERVIIHDAARPLAGPDLIGRVITALDRHPGAIAAMPVADTLKRGVGTGIIEGTVDRGGLWHAQTPQGFEFAAILQAHRKAQAEGRDDFTDDAALAEWCGLEVGLVTGSASNMKITTAEDLVIAGRLLGAAAPQLLPRTGTGFDVHRFAPGDHVWLCGVRIAHTRRLEGHSDADVGLHALTDALLGALGDGDIGAHFPPSDPRWKDAPSRIFLADAAARVAARGGIIVNVDVTLLCEEPRIGPHRDAMRSAVAGILGIELGRVGVKATTTEGLGFTGRREGIAAMASALILLPP